MRAENLVRAPRPGGQGVMRCSFLTGLGKNLRPQRGSAFPLVWPSAIVGGGSFMLKVKDTLRATVHLTFDGRVIKHYHGPDAQTRFENEVRILRHLEARGCNFVPKLLEADATQPRIITSNCGARVQHLDEKRTRELFAELEPYGVRHDDPDIRNVTYRQTDGRFCVIDFEFATLLPGAESAPTP